MVATDRDCKDLAYQSFWAFGEAKFRAQIWSCRVLQWPQVQHIPLICLTESQQLMSLSV
jgi:hypothetical protein